MAELDWDKESSGVNQPKKLGIPGLSKEDMEKLKPSEINKIGQLTKETIEGIIVGYMIFDRDVGDPAKDKKNADKLVESPIDKSWFSNEGMGLLYDKLVKFYRHHKSCASVDDIRAQCESESMPTDTARVYQNKAVECHVAAVTRGIPADILIDMMVNRHRDNEIKKTVETYRAQYNDEKFGPKKARENLRLKMVKVLEDPANAVIKERNWVGSADETMGRMLDMKKNPGKYEGFRCGLSCIDQRTSGFRPGQLTIIVGKTGGYKSTLMMNIALRLWLRGLDVLYASFEMEQWVVETKLWCMFSRVSYSSCLNGLISEPNDREEIAALSIKLEDKGLDDATRKKIQRRVDRLKSSGVMNVEAGNEDWTRLMDAKKALESAKNQFFIITAGQSQKIKVGQIETFIADRKTEWQPNVVCVDYLDHVDSDVPHGDRKDLEIGEVCKRLRNMGMTHNFTTITAAQYKRGVVERVNNAGGAAKAGLSTEDIANANTIGNDADTVFMLWPEQGGNLLRVFTPKARFGQADGDGKVIQVDPVSHYMSEDDIDGTEGLIAAIHPSEGPKAAKEIADGKVVEASTDEDPSDVGFFKSPSEVDSGQVDDDDPLADPSIQPDSKDRPDAPWGDL